MGVSVDLLEVSLRDGLQDEPCFVSTAEKVEIAAALAHAGVRHIEATSFVRPEWVPQLADADALVPQLPPGPNYSALVMNERGYERARAAFAGVPFERYALTFVASASPRHNLSNNNRTIEQTLAIFDAVAALARADGIRLHGAISCSFVSPYADEPTDPVIVADIASQYAARGCSSITLADTVGRADPVTVGRRVEEIARAVNVPLSLHLHDSYGYALANVYAGLERAVRRFECALAGLGGCPFAPNAPGNLDAERLAGFLKDCGAKTGIDLDELARARERIKAALRSAKPLATAAHTV